MSTLIFAHGDADGIVSAAISLAALKSESKVFFTHPAGLYEDMVHNIKYENKIVIVDIALNEAHLEEFYKYISALSRRGVEIVYIDHHPEPLGIRLKEFPMTIIHNLNSSSSELTFKYFENKLDEDMSRVAIYGAISDYLDETPWVKRVLKDWDKRAVYFEAGVLSQGLEGARKLYDFKRRVVIHLSENKLPSEMSELVVRALMETVIEEEMRRDVKVNAKALKAIAYVINPKGSVSRAATYVRAYLKKPVGVAVEIRKSIAILSLRSIDERINLNSILRKITLKHGGSGGGHAWAAGARVPVEKLYYFLKELDEEISSAI